ncbi:hypothetical protein [Shewanella frigidimarina]|uniref:hypothetical protein n=1 Tax=Shewanella frigidimarina TaxID=56812 RepID=UPI003D79943E
MAKTPKKQLCFIQISGAPKPASINTIDLFCNNNEVTLSPIDTYIKRNKSLLVKLGKFERAQLLDITDTDDRDIYNLLLLGFISNVESYFRYIMRELILIDKISYQTCLEQSLTYAAAVHHEEKLLPEALLENCTFISFDNIKSTTKSYLDVTINKQSIEHKELVESLIKFEELCQLRHCIVHRGGFLGSKNAIKLGIDKHKSYFEKPIAFNSTFLQEASTICLNSVRLFNNFLFNTLLHRKIESEKLTIEWDFRKDKTWFNKYFLIFNSLELNIEQSNLGLVPHTSISSYEEYRSYYETL